ncbi:PEP/pyruvate-binding domain-containing protein [Spartinivicinus poritis]|uniref:PEP-utilizing enzyme n=1 Tax=Spartinivicinus poritis TaxID=2994640 RepID=A0ABT5UDH8_9GAMM|nr:PEP/pyruvate-binding domain-containing protein [Spartinivicinus sp. A2-2]MDE1464420.1 PEP-utilizing enzyme [Spartinivicinus sp. A2-2]
MTLLYFNDINQNNKEVGGKAYNLACLYQGKLPVPEGIILTALPTKQAEWDEIFDWWNSIGYKPLAVRSSASDEDDSQVSFAGQNNSYLNVRDNQTLQITVTKCFDSINKISSKVYREHFLGKTSSGSMNVLVQIMVKPKFSGVYFSSDPRGKKTGDLIEFIEGYGEALVSGKQTPYRIYGGVLQENHSMWKKAFTDDIQKMGEIVKSLLGVEVDMEWAIDEEDQLKLLQARPITAAYTYSTHLRIVEQELERLHHQYDQNTTWDGQTFAEWTGIQSYITYTLWQKAFSPHNAFGDALKKLGYLSFVDNDFSPHESILDRVFGRAYINLNKMFPLYFGPIPYSIDLKPRPHLKFSIKELTAQSLIRTPLAIYNMVKVGWNLSSRRKYWQDQCLRELAKFKHKMDRPFDPTMYQSWENVELLKRFAKECHVFTKNSLLWPFILIILTEATLHSLEAILSNLLGEQQAKKTLKRWMAIGLKTVSYEMNRYFKRACEDVNKQPFFMARYGHRGAGELDLSNPRWIELGQKAFVNLKKIGSTSEEINYATDKVEDEINNLKTFKKSIILQEWQLLKSMLELRESWKMEILKPFAHIRYIAQEIGKRSKLFDDIYLLGVDEIINDEIISPVNISDEIIGKIKDRKQQSLVFKRYSLPMIVSLNKLDELISGNHSEEADCLDGEPISPGLVYGTVKVVSDISQCDMDSLPEDTIIVAESTDPGWTPLFTKSVGIIVEKGGILSHSAIVAREMGIPAISGIRDCINKLRDGQKICLDGNNGHISYELH